MRKKIQLLLLAVFSAFALQAQFSQIGNKLVGTGAIGNHGQGSKVAFSDQGNIAVVGGPYDNNNIGAVWVYTFDGTNYTQLGSKLVPSDGNTSLSGLLFGFGALDITSNGKCIVVGGNYDAGGVGAVWIFTFNGTNFVQLGNKLVGSGIIGQGYFGISGKFSKDGTTLVIGGAKNNDYEGATWIYTFNGSNFVQFGGLLKANDAQYGPNGPQQGYEVDISDDNKTIVVGGVWDNSRVGATWVYTFNGTNYVQFGNKLVGSGSVQGSYASEQGHNVKISGNGNLIISSGWTDNDYKGALWVYSFNGTNFAQLGSKFVPNDLSSVARFGVSMDLSGDEKYLAIGAHLDNNNTGAAYIFTFNGTGFDQSQPKIVAIDVVTNNYFGSAVAFSRNTNKLLIGGHAAGTTNGGVWIYEKPNTNPVNQTIDLQNGLVAYYPFNGNANDESGNGNNGTVVGASFAQDRFGFDNKSYSFNGTSQYISVAGNNFNLTNDISISLWFNPENSKMNEYAGIIDKSHSHDLNINTQGGWVIERNSFSNQFYFGYLCSTTPGICYTNQTNLPYTNKQWQHYIFTKHGSTVTGYFNGILNNVLVFSNSEIQYNNRDFPLVIGAQRGTDGTIYRYFNGKIDDIKIYNRALNQAEIQTLYIENQPVDLQNGLVAYYPFNGNANDESGNGNNGTITSPNFINDRLGKSSSAIEVDRTSFSSGSGYVTSNSTVGNIGTGDFTFSVWFNPNDLSNSQYILAKRQNSLLGNQVDLAFDSNKLHLEISESDLNYIDIHGSTFISTNAWHHAVIIRKSNVAYIYVDGQLDVMSIVGTINVNNSFPFTIGVNKETLSSPFGFFNGFIDEVKIYNRALNESEIQALYEDCVSIPAPTIAITSNKLNTTSLSGFIYQWYLNETTIAGVNANVLNDQLQIGVYKVNAKTGNCVASSLPFNIGTFPDPVTLPGTFITTVTVYKIIIIEDNGNTITGIIQRKENENVSIYPNPNKGVFRIESNLVPIEKIEIFNLQGVRVHETKEKEINIKGMPNGSYILKLFDPDSKVIETRKMLIE